ncbi:uncharacterized protein LOC130810002 isoform X2 [Amaranthus tricolor]|uniref:uncharacterized protein LOC130810002 isoform X2 n=1 Tax=Amaranthus tricolor TaxID=29722 RepID=UPI0025903FB4|nr:uncharacterized protein LOC130810002 isoform X2 [Amaranthus tricolor]
MDHRHRHLHLHHHHNQPDLQPQPRPFMDSSSRYLPFRPLHPFSDDHRHHHPNPFSPPPQQPLRNLPPPPQHHHHHNPPSCLIHHPRPLPPSHSHQKPFQDRINFVDSPPHHHQHHHPPRHSHNHNQIPHRRIVDNDDIPDEFQSPTRVIHDPDRLLSFHNHNHNHIHHNNLDEIDYVDRRPRFRFNELPPPPTSRVPPPSSPVARRSPPRFVQLERFRRKIDSPPRRREDFNLNQNPNPNLESPRARLYPDDIGFHQLHHVDRGDDCRVLKAVDRLEGNFDPDHHDREHHERYLPETVIRKQYEVNSGISDLREILNDEAFIRRGRDDVVLDEKVNSRRSSGGSREVSHSPIKFRNGVKSVEDGISDIQGNPRKNVQKMSAFLRIQPANPQHSNSNGSLRKKYDNKSSSPHNGKKSNSECLDRRTSSEERVRSPVDLDLSFKSNALVAKAITAAPSCSSVDYNVNDSDSGTRIDGERSSKGMGSKISSLVSKREGKDGKNKVRVSPIMKRLGNPNSELESSRIGSSSLSESPKMEVLGKDDRNFGFEKVSSSPVRKKRKSVSSLSRLSIPVPTKTGSELLNVDSPANNTSTNSLPFDVSVNHSEKGLSCATDVIGSTENVQESLTVVDHKDILRGSFEDPAVKRMREDGALESAPSSHLSLGLGVYEGHDSIKVKLQDEQKTLNFNGDVTKPVEKCSSDFLTEKGCVTSQDLTPVLVDNGSAEGTVGSVVVCMKDNVDNTGVCCENLDPLNPVVVASSVPVTVDVSNKGDNKGNLALPLLNGNETSETHVVSTPENATTGLALAGLDTDRSYEPELRDSEDSGKGENIDGVTFGSKNINTVADVGFPNDIQEQQNLGPDTRLVDDESTLEKEEPPKTCVTNRKRKVGTESDLIHLRTFEFSHENAILPIEEHVPVSDTLSVESDVSLGKSLIGGSVECMNSMDCVKKRKILPLESVLSDAPGSGSSEFIPIPGLPSVTCSPQAVEGSEPPKSAPSDKDTIGRVTSSLCAETCSSADNPKSDILCKDSSLSIAGTYPSGADEESGCNQKSDASLVMAGDNDENGFIALESSCEMATNDGGSAANHTEYADEGPPEMNMECDSTAQEAILASLSDFLQSCVESTYGGVRANSDMLELPSIVAIPEAQPVLLPTSGASNASPEIQVTLGEKLCIHDKQKDQPLANHRSFTSQCNVLAKNQNLKSDVSPLLDVQPLSQKSASLLSKKGKTTVSSSNASTRLRRNVLIRAESSPSTNLRSSVIKPNNRSQTYPAKPRTWHRTNNSAASNMPVKKPPVATPPQRPLYGKALKVMDTSYIRKGNSLVRNPVSGLATSGFRTSGAATSRTSGAAINRSQSNDTDRITKVSGSVMIESTELPDGLVTGGQSASIELPKTSPLLCSDKTSSSHIANSEDCTSSLAVHQTEVTDNKEAFKSSDMSSNSSRDPESVVNRNMEDPGMFSDGDVVNLNSKMFYIKHKSNQLIATSKTSPSSLHSMDSKMDSSSDVNYYKNRQNQLIRASSEGNLPQMVSSIAKSSKSLSQRKLRTYSGRSSSKRHSNKVKSSKLSLVWKLGDSKSCGKGIHALRSGRLLSHLLPWKRTTRWSRKLLSSKKRGVVYVRSGHGFSLRRSKVISLHGNSLKWSISMEKRSKRVEEDAAMAVAAMDFAQKSGSSGIGSKQEGSMHSLQEPGHCLKQRSGERIFRIGVHRYRMDPSRRTLQKISDEEADVAASTTEKDARKVYVPKRLLIGSNEYVRIGNGNKLVLDPKRRTRVLASEKVRWSLHTARRRLAKKRKFCQFFTRFGKCNKVEGKCPFIHDPSKVVVCTKFLNGSCADPNCKLTHKVIPDRMPDCSFFLQGLCSNEKCPYRHVSVNPKASICESFLRGYCAEGNENASILRKMGPNLVKQVI